MPNLNEEMLEKLYNSQKKRLALNWIITIAVIVLTSFIRLLFSDVFENSSSLILIHLLISIIPFIFIFYTYKKIIPAGNGGLVRKAYKVLQQDYSSEASVEMLYRFIGQSSKYPEKVRLTLLLADIQTLRGNINEALQLLYSVDRSGFDKYPDLGMSFYAEIISVYNNIDDSESVIRAYADSEIFMERAALNNYSCCITAFGAMTCVEKARGNYKRALELRLIRNKFENQFNSSIGASQQGTPLSRLISGSVFCETAELYYLCGDLDSAAKYLDIGGPMVSGCKFALEEANKLSEKLRTELNKR